MLLLHRSRRKPPCGEHNGERTDWVVGDRVCQRCIRCGEQEAEDNQNRRCDAINPAIKVRMTTKLLAAATAVTAAITLAPFASAQAPTLTVSNSAGNVRCELTQFGAATETLCVSDTARQTQPECNPEGQLIPAIAIQDKFVDRKCWNQGFADEPQRLGTLQSRSLGTATVFQGFSGNLYVFDTAQRALIRAGSANAVLFDF